MGLLIIKHFYREESEISANLSTDLSADQNGGLISTNSRGNSTSPPYACN